MTRSQTHKIISINNNNSNYKIVIVIIKKIIFLPSFSFLFSGVKENWPFKTFKIVLLGQFNFRVLLKNCDGHQTTRCQLNRNFCANILNERLLISL